MAFQHKSLSKKSKQIRLVQVLSTGSEQPRCSIVHTDLGASAPYQALSYTWGFELSQHDIEINSKSFRVGQNLLDFLCTYQRVKRPRDRTYLWIDQISIDQQNEIEKSWQVQLMSQIYQSAFEVICWLGPANAHTPTAIWMLDLLESDYKLLHDATWINRDHELSGPARRFFEDLVHTVPVRAKRTWPRPDEDGVVLQDSCREAMSSLLANSYWTRLWIVQEIMLARKMTAWWGDHQITRDGLVGFTEKIHYTYEDDDLVPWSRLGMILKKGLHREVPLGYDPASVVSEELQTLISTFCSYGCKNRKDKVFGLMAIVRSDSVIEVDYSKSTTDVYLQAVRVMGDGIIREAVRLRVPPSWESYLDTSCRLGVQMLPSKFGHLDAGRGFDRFRVAKGAGISPDRFFNEVSDKDKPQYLVKKLSRFL